MPIQFTATESLENSVASIESAFRVQNIRLTDNAKVLIALALHAQETDREPPLPPGEILRRMTDPNRIRLEDVVENYKHTYRGRKLNFNRAFHVLHEVSSLAKYPWTPAAE